MRLATTLVLAAVIGLVGLAGLAGLFACGKQAAAPDDRVAGLDYGEVADGKRRIPIEVKRNTYVPASLAARAGEQLVLVFTRTEKGECGRYVKVPGHERVELPMDEPVALDVTMPASGELRFACGMDMMTGVVTVATP